VFPFDGLPHTSFVHKCNAPCQIGHYPIIVKLDIISVRFPLTVTGSPSHESFDNQFAFPVHIFRNNKNSPDVSYQRTALDFPPVDEFQPNSRPGPDSVDTRALGVWEGTRS
jgi:hypothetical protein